MGVNTGPGGARYRPGDEHFSSSLPPPSLPSTFVVGRGAGDEEDSLVLRRKGWESKMTSRANDANAADGGECSHAQNTDAGAKSGMSPAMRVLYTYSCAHDEVQ